MKASIITIGDEILIGQILDTNSQWIANHLHDLGVELVEIVCISDTKEAIVNGVDHALSFADLVIVTGGLGPTKDDVTKHTLVDYFDDELVINQEVLNNIKAIFNKRNIPFSNLNRDQALLPKNGTILPNKLGTASGMWFKKDGKIVVSLPGVPFEMKGLMTDEVLPKLRKVGNFPFQEYQTFILYGLGESSAAERLEEFEENLPEFIKLAYLPKPGRLTFRLTGKSKSKELLTKTLAELGTRLMNHFPDYRIVKGSEDSIALLKHVLINNGKTLAVAESCTGGKIASEIAAINGVSKFFLGGVVAYNVLLKQIMLNVSAKTIETYSVVSEQVAKEMVVGIQKKTGANYAIATTGNAGPTTDKTDETVGVVYIGVAVENEVFVERFNFGKPREKVIEQAKNKAFELLVKEILKNQ